MRKTVEREKKVCKYFILALFIKMIWMKNGTNDTDHTGGLFVVSSCVSWSLRTGSPIWAPLRESCLQSLRSAAVVRWTGALNIRQDGVVQETCSVRLVLPHPLDLRLFQSQLLQHGGHLAFPVKHCLFVVAAQHCRSVSRKEKQIESM